MKPINVLIVEDVGENTRFLSPLLDKEFVSARSVSNALEAQRALTQESYDVVILDIQIPNDLGEPIDPQGGVKLLEWLIISPTVNMPYSVIGVTSSQESCEEHQLKFREAGFHLLKSSSEEDSWLTTIVRLCTHASSYLSQIKTEDDNVCDVAIVTALSHNELAAVLSGGPQWQQLTLPNDPAIYHEATLETSSGLKRIIATSSPRMGMAAASSVATKVCLKFSPQYLVMTGIAAGIKEKGVQFGDILAGDPCWDWGNGKLTEVDGVSIFQPAPHQVALSAAIRAKLQHCRDQNKYVSEIYQNWLAPKPTTPLRLHIGPVASGAVVLEDPETLESIRRQHRETIGVEMEAYGVMASQEIASSEGTVPIVLKSVCDFANREKNDDWQSYASYTSAHFALEFIKNDLY